MSTKRELYYYKNYFEKFYDRSLVVICIQDTGDKVHILNQAIDAAKSVKRLADMGFTYTFEDSDSRHTAETDYRMPVIEK